MRVLLLLASASVGQTQLPGEPDLSAYTYADYRKDFPRRLESGEGSRRHSVFETNMVWIRSHNANTDKRWFATVNQFTDMTNEEFRTHIKGRARDGPLFSGKSEHFELSAADLPERVDWREQEPRVVTPPKDQGACGSCWAFSAASTFESHLALATGERAKKLSPQQIVDCAPNPQHCGGKGGCDGSTQPLAFDYTKTAGLTTEVKYPYMEETGTCASKIEPYGFNKGHVELPQNNYTALVSAVGTKGPIAISIAAGGLKFQFYGGGVMDNCNDYVMDHAVQLVGYGSDKDKSDGTVDYWLVRNSWGGNWGEEGYVRIRRHGEGKEPCGTDDKPQDGDACDGDTTPRKLCGECAILSSSSYPTGMTKVDPGPETLLTTTVAPPSPSTSPAPTTPLPNPDCKDTEEDWFCYDIEDLDMCKDSCEDATDASGPCYGCLRTCGCCDETPAEYCSSGKTATLV